jgi:D-methionine transport system ATP-binding protein
VIDLQHISIAYKSNDRVIDAVKNVTLKIDQGEILGIVGTSGAGKSSLLRSINLLERSTTGKVWVNGVDLMTLNNCKLRRERQKIGMIFQHFNLMQTRSVYENIAFPLRVAGKSKNEVDRQVPKILELVGLSDKAKAYPAQLSGGQKQRVGIARGVVNHPHILLCDEPTSALDLETASSILELLRHVNKGLGITVVIVSHEMHVIKSICHRVAVMDAGRLVESAQVYDIFLRPQHLATKRLVEGSFSVGIPETFRSNGQGKIIKIFFAHDNAHGAILSEIAIRYGILANILNGRVENIGQKIIGALLIYLEHAYQNVKPERGRSIENMNAAIRYLKEHSIGLEILHVE